MTYTFHFYKEFDGRWYFDDELKDIYHEEMVAGVDEILDYYAENRNFVNIEVTDKRPSSIANYAILNFVEEYEGGVIYCEDDSIMYIEGWFCPTFWKYYKRPAPLRLYFRVL